MKTDIEIVTGFLGAGKTTFINSLLETTLVDKEKVLVLLCEKGEKAVKESLLKDKRVEVVEHDPLKPFNLEYIKNLLKLHCPHRLIIEYNGTRPLEELTAELNTREIREFAVVTSIFHIADGVTFDLFLDNMSNILQPCILSSHLVVVTNTDKLDSTGMNSIKRRIEAINPNAYIITCGSGDDLGARLKAENILDSGIMKRLRILMKNSLKK